MRRIKLTYNDKLYVKNIPTIHHALICTFEAKTIYSRFDALYQLIDSCDQYLSNLTHSDSKITNLRERAFKMAKAIVGAKNIQELKIKKEKRDKYRQFDSEYMPWQAPISREAAFETDNRKSYLSRSWQIHCKNIAQQKYLFLNELNYIVDKADKVRYLKGEQREPYRVFTVNTQFMHFRLSNPVHKEYASLYLENFDTKYYEAHAHKGSAIFIITPKGDIFVGSSEACKFYHSSMINGGVVTYAGTLKITRGTLKEIDNRSGHYKPSRHYLMNCLDYFNACGVLNKSLDATSLSLPDFTREKITYPVGRKITV